MNWAATPLGAPETWPAALKTLVSVMLEANEPMYVAWGGERTMIYNDAFATVLQDRHPAALGARFNDVWYDILDEVGGIVDCAFAGQSSRKDDLEITILRGGRRQETHFSYSLTPVRDETGRVGGVFCTCAETTERVFAERRVAFMLRLEQRLRGLGSAEAIIEAAAEETGLALKVSKVGYAEIDPSGEWSHHLTGWSDGTPPGLRREPTRVKDFGQHVDELRAGIPVVLDDVTTDPRTSSPEQLALHAALSVRAVIVFPLIKEGRLAAWMYCLSAQPRVWSSNEVALLAEVAERTWSAVERAKAEWTQRESDERLTTVVRDAPVGIILAEAPSGRVLLANEQVARIWGAPPPCPQSIEEYGVFRAADPVDGSPSPPEQWPLARAITAGENIVGEEIEFHRLDGACGTLSVNASPIRDPAGQVIAGVLTAEDVTGRRATEAALRRLNDNLESEIERRTQERDRIWKLSRDLMCVARTNGEILSANPAWERMFSRGATVELPGEAQRAATELARRAAGHPAVNFERRYQCRDGTWRWIAWAVETEADLIYGVGRDITEDREAQEALARADAERRETAAVLSAYFEHSGEPLFIMGVRDDGRLTLEQTNPEHGAVTGVELERVRGLPLEEQFTPEGAAGISPPLYHAAETGQVHRYRETLNFGTGFRHWDTVVVPVLGEDGKTVRLVGSARDVTAQVMAEEALRQAQKMEAVGQLTGGISHDFNNLLGAVIGALDIIQRKPADTDRVRQFAAVGMEAANRGVKLTRQLLAFSRVQQIELKPVVVAEAVEGMREMLSRALGPLVKLRCELGGVDASALSDPTQLEMAVLNLAINARDAMPEGGELFIALSLRRIEGDPELPPGEYVELSVRDTGTGMPPDVLARAVDPFFTTKGPGKGTGLGLSQVYGIARQSGGTARIESQPGAGTTVRLLLPVTRALPAEPPESAHAAAHAAAPGSSILVVEDDAAVRRVLTTSLDAIGYRVLEAEDGPSGLAQLEAKAPDLMLVDYAMPGMNGAEVAKAARALRPDLPIVFATGYADVEAIAQAAGPDAIVLHKPFRLGELQAAIEDALAHGPH